MKPLPTSEPTDRSPFAQRLREARIRANYTQSELAMLLGVTQTAISYWENGDREPSLGTIVQFCDVLHVSPNYLIRGDVPDFPWAIQRDTNRVPPRECIKTARDALNRAYGLGAASEQLWPFLMEALDWQRRALEQIAAAQEEKAA